jgi:hypothetical protein
VSEKHGGKVHLDNLRPICSACNKSIGAKNMEKFMEQYGFVESKNWHGIDLCCEPLGDQNKIQTSDQNKIHINDQNKIQINDQNKIQINDQNKIQINDQNKIQTSDQNKIQINDQNKIQTSDQNKIQINDQNNDQNIECSTKDNKLIDEDNKLIDEDNKLIDEDNKLIDDDNKSGIMFYNGKPNCIYEQTVTNNNEEFNKKEIGSKEELKKESEPILKETISKKKELKLKNFKTNAKNANNDVNHKSKDSLLDESSSSGKENIMYSKKPKNKYQLFVSKELKKQRSEKPGLNNREYMCLAAKEWNKYKMENDIKTDSSQLPT